VTAWLICGAVAVVLGLATWGLASRTSREMPPYPRVGLDSMGLPPPRPFGRCPGCGTLRPLDASGLVGGHDRPDPWVPYDVQSTPCRGAGQAPMQAEASER
jgi:hypothetical protein